MLGKKIIIFFGQLLMWSQINFTFNATQQAEFYALPHTMLFLLFVWESVGGLVDEGSTTVNGFAAICIRLQIFKNKNFWKEKEVGMKIERSAEFYAGRRFR